MGRNAYDDLAAFQFWLEAHSKQFKPTSVAVYVSRVRTVLTWLAQNKADFATFYAQEPKAYRYQSAWEHYIDFNHSLGKQVSGLNPTPKEGRVETFRFSPEIQESIKTIAAFGQFKPIRLLALTWNNVYDAAKVLDPGKVAIDHPDHKGHVIVVDPEIIIPLREWAIPGDQSHPLIPDVPRSCVPMEETAFLKAIRSRRSQT